MQTYPSTQCRCRYFFNGGCEPAQFLAVFNQADLSAGLDLFVTDTFATVSSDDLTLSAGLLSLAKCCWGLGALGRCPRCSGQAGCMQGECKESHKAPYPCMPPARCPTTNTAAAACS